MISEKTIHKAGRVDQAVREFFRQNPYISEVAAMDLMKMFIEKEIFNKDYSRPGKPIRDLLRELDASNKLDLLKHCKVIRHAKNRSWYFQK